MRFELDEVTRSVEGEMTRRAMTRLASPSSMGAHDVQSWRAVAEFGLLTAVEDGLRDIDVVAGFMAVAKGGLPGPLLEAALAVDSGCAQAVDLVRAGKLVSSVPPGPAGSVLAGWGAVADLIVEQGSGTVLSQGPGMPVETGLPMDQARVERAAGGEDPLAARRWLLAAALQVGLGTGQIHLATQYVKGRVQFGRPLASFQAVQFRLAEATLKVDAGRLLVIDAARRSDASDPFAEIAAALAWIYLSSSSEFVEKQVHQVFGAMGFTEEAGLIRLTYQSAWLRTSVGRTAAVALVQQQRTTDAAVPASTVAGGFATVG